METLVETFEKKKPFIAVLKSNGQLFFFPTFAFFFFLLPQNSLAQIDNNFFNGGGIRVGDSTTACAGNGGGIRFDANSSDGGGLQYCDGTNWLTMLTSTFSGVVNNGNSFAAPMIIGTNDNNTLSFETAGTTRMTIGTSGNVGIGTTSPTSALQIFGSSGLSIGDITPKSSSRAALALTAPSGSETRIEMTGNRGAGDLPSNTMEFYNDSTQIAAIEIRTAASTSTGEIQFSTNDGTLSERVRIASNGNVGIGTTAPGGKLDVAGDIRMHGSTSGYNGFQAAATATDLIYTLPSTNPTAGEILSSDASGNLSWIAAGGSGDFKADGSVPMTGELELLSENSASDPDLTFNGDENTGLFQPAADEIAFTNAGLESVRIDSSGNIGVGTSTLTSSTGSAGRIFRISNEVTNHQNAELILSGRGTAIGRGGVITGEDNRITDPDKRLAAIGLVREDSGTTTNSDGQITFHTTEDGSISQNMTLTSNGHLGIGTTTPTPIENGSESNVIHLRSGTGSAEINLDATGTSSNYTSALNLLNNGTRVSYIRSAKSTGSATDGNLEFATHNGTTLLERMRIDKDGNLGIGTTTPNVALDVNGSIEYTGTITDVSDRRLKENIKPISNALETIAAVDGVSFIMKGDEKRRIEFGVIAQDVEDVLPELVHTADDEMKSKSVNYVGFIGWLIEAIKDLVSNDDNLQSQIDEKDKRISNLENEIRRQNKKIESLKSLVEEKLK